MTIAGFNIDLRKYLRALHERGWKSALKEICLRINRYLRIMEDRKFDREFGTDTSGIIEPEKLDISDQQKASGFHYEPTPVAALKKMLRHLDIEHSKYLFIDYGSGKGRVLLLASNDAYKKIIGVEFSERLHNIAVENIRKWSCPGRRCHEIESICQDAKDFIVPPDPLVIFFFTPFKPSVIQQVVCNLRESYSRNPRPIHILYYGTNPEFAGILSSLGVSPSEIYNRRPFSAVKRYKGLYYFLNPATVAVNN